MQGWYIRALSGFGWFARRMTRMLGESERREFDAQYTCIVCFETRNLSFGDRPLERLLIFCRSALFIGRYSHLLANEITATYQSDYSYVVICTSPLGRIHHAYPAGNSARVCHSKRPNVPFCIFCPHTSTHISSGSDAVLCVRLIKVSQSCRAVEHYHGLGAGQVQCRPKALL